MALAWLLAQKPWIVPIGTTKLRGLKENARRPLSSSPTAISTRRKAACQITVQEARYSESGLVALGGVGKIIVNVPVVSRIYQLRWKSPVVS